MAEHGGWVVDKISVCLRSLTVIGKNILVLKMASDWSQIGFVALDNTLNVLLITVIHHY